jgi:ribonuclease HI
MSKDRILILHPNGILGANSFYRKALVTDELQPFVEMDATKGADPNAVKEAVLSGKFSTILVCDLSTEQRWFTSKFRACLKAFVSAGGMIAWPTTEGGQLNEMVLKPIFDVGWEMAEYFRTDFSKTSAPVTSWFQNGPRTINVKASMLKNVSEEEKVYAIERGARHQSVVFGFDPCKEGEVGLASVIVGKYGQGQFAYFGDVNGEEPTVKLVITFLNAARSRNVCLRGQIEHEVPEKPLQIWADGACLGNHQHGQERCAGIGVFFEANSGLPAVFGPIEGNWNEATSNVAELQAAIMALILAMKYGRKNVQLNTDSEYLKNCMTKWIEGWKNNGWRKKTTGQPPANLAYLKRLDVQNRSMSIKWNWIPREQNKTADALAQMGCQTFLQTGKGHKYASIVDELERFIPTPSQSTLVAPVQLVTTRRVLVSGSKRLQVCCPFPPEMGSREICILPHKKAAGLCEVKKTKTTVGLERKFRMPVINRGWSELDAFGMGHVNNLKMLLPPGSIVGMGFSEACLKDRPSPPFKMIEYLPHEDHVGDDATDDESYIDDGEDDDFEDDSDEDSELVLPEFGVEGLR